MLWCGLDGGWVDVSVVGDCCSSMLVLKDVETHVLLQDWHCLVER